MRYLIVLILMPILQILTALIFRETVSISNSFWNTYILVFIQQIVSVYLPVLFLFRKETYCPKDELYWIKPSYLIRFMILGIILQFFGIAMNMPLSFWLNSLGFSARDNLPLPTAALQFLGHIGVVCLTPAIFEEVLFRRMIYRTIQRDSSSAAILFSAIFFSMAHCDFFNISATFVIGLCLGLLRYQGATLILCIITHFFINFTASMMNLGFQIPIVSDYFQRYYPLLFFLSAIFLCILLPKKNLQNVLSDDSAQGTVADYLLKLVKNPLFYGYIIIFLVLGVRSL